MPTRRRRPDSAGTREAIVRSAAEVIARRGFAAASVDEIAEHAGYSIGALYSHFTGKDAVLLAAARQHNADAARLFERRRDETTTVEERSTAIARVWIDSVTENPLPLLLWVELWARAVRAGPPLSDELAAGSRATTAAFRSMALDAARSAGVELDDEDADQLAALADAAGLGFAMRRLLDPDAAPPELFETVSRRWLSAVLWAIAEEQATGGPSGPDR